MIVNMLYILRYVIVIMDLLADQINIDGGTLHRDSISPSVDSNPAWDIMDIMNNVKVSLLQTVLCYLLSFMHFL